MNTPTPITVDQQTNTLTVAPPKALAQLREEACGVLHATRERQAQLLEQRATIDKQLAALDVELKTLEAVAAAYGNSEPKRKRPTANPRPVDPVNQAPASGLPGALSDAALIKDLGLSLRAMRVVTSLASERLTDLALHTTADVLHVEGTGRKTLDELRKTLSAAGLRFVDEPVDESLTL